jgi:hypothetical protein
MFVDEGNAISTREEKFVPLEAVDIPVHKEHLQPEDARLPMHEP